MRKFTPRPYQTAATQFLLEKQRGALFVDMGLGKTSSVLNAIEALDFCGELGKVLIVAPLRVARSTWSDEVAKWEHTRHLTIDTIVGTAEERLAALHSDSQIKTINYENLEWLVLQLKDQWPFKVVVLDESTKVKSFRAHYKKGKNKTFLVCTEGKRAGAIIRHVLKRTDWVWLLTGTPCQNSLRELWAQLFFIDGGKRLGKSYSAFEERWFRTHFNGHTKIPFPHSAQEIHDAIQDVVFTLRAEDYLRLGEEVLQTIPVELPPEAARLYQSMEEELFIILEAGAVEAFSAPAQWMKLRQIANGAVYYDKEGRFEVVHDEKVEALRSVIEEANGMPVIVVYTFKSDLAILKKAFPKGRVFDKKGEADFKAGKVEILFLHPDSAGHGVDGLQNITNVICFYSVDWNAETRSQVIARVGKVRQFQAGFDRPVFIYQIIAKGTIDETILERIDEKISVEDALKRRLARRIK